MSATTRRSIVVAFRLTPAEAAHLTAAGSAMRTPRNLADYCRAAALHIARKQVPPPAKGINRPARRKPALDTRLLAQILGQVGKIGDELNKIAGRADAAHYPPVALTIPKIATEIGAIRQAVIEALTGSGGPQ